MADIICEQPLIRDWDNAKFQEAFTDMENIARHLTNFTNLIDEFKKAKYQGEKFLQAVASLKSLVEDGQFDQIKRKEKKD